MPASDFLLRLFGSATATGRRLAFDRDPAAIYAIGDVHGCLDLLLRLEAAIVADAETIPGDVWLLLLGDVIDRGPNPAGVIEHLLAPPPARFSRYCLMGNHEDMMLDFLARPSPAAPRTLAGDLQQKLNAWTGLRWSVSIAREGGAPTLAEQRKAAKAARMESVAQEPMVRAVLDRFPGAEIVAVRDVAPEDVAAPMPDESDA